ATNTLIERRGATVGMITNAGFRDILEFQRLKVPNPMSFEGRRPASLIPRSLVREVAGRMDAQGNERTPLDLDQVGVAARELVAACVGEVLVCFLHSFRNGAQEEVAAAAVVRDFPELNGVPSAGVWAPARQ